MPKRKTQAQRQTALFAVLEQMAEEFRSAGGLSERAADKCWYPSAANRMGADRHKSKGYTLMGRALNMHRAAVRAAVRDARRRF